VHHSITQFLQERFRAGDDLGGDTPLFSSGIVDSFGVLELIAFLEDTFHVTIDPGVHDLEEFDTVDKIAELVARAPRTGRA
jgi:acyl carrier protein